MKAFVIALAGNDYSERKAQRCIESAGRLKVRKFKAVDHVTGPPLMAAHGLKWTWAKGNKEHAVCPYTGLKQHPYGRLEYKIGCFMSHYLLWEMCARDGPFLILEHDAVFLQELPYIHFDGICQINDPRGATPKGAWWSDRMAERGPGVFPKTHVFRDRPDGLAGNSAYLLSKWAAADLVDIAHRIGVWPNDALMCRQLFPYLQEHYPFITKVEQEISTSS